MSNDYIECCASGSCEVCGRPSGYSTQRRQEIADDMSNYDPPWVRERERREVQR